MVTGHGINCSALITMLRFVYFVLFCHWWPLHWCASATKTATVTTASYYMCVREVACLAHQQLARNQPCIKCNTHTHTRTLWTAVSMKNSRAFFSLLSFRPHSNVSIIHSLSHTITYAYASKKKRVNIFSVHVRHMKEICYFLVAPPFNPHRSIIIRLFSIKQTFDVH